MHTLWTDLRYAMRQLRRSPSFAFTTILTLTMAIAANVIVFGVVDALVLHPLPVPESGRLFQIQEAKNISFSYPNYRDLRDRNSTFSSLALARLARVGVGVDGIAQPVWGYEASGNYFETLGVQPRLGRFFSPKDDVAVNGSPVAVLSYACWQVRFHGEAGIVGKTVLVSKHPYTVVGVAPRDFSGSERFIWPEIWVPFHNAPEIEGNDQLEQRGNAGAWIVGRLKPGVSQEQATADLERVAAILAKQYPNEDQGLRLHLSRPGLIGDMLGKPVRIFLSGVMAMALLVLLAACANLGALFSSRTADRARELGIRLAIGSSRGQILRQLITESTFIALLGGAIASIVSLALLRGLSHWSPPFGELPIRFLVEPHWTVFVFAALLALATGLLFGLIPARQIWKTDPNETLKAAGSTSSPTRSWFRSGLLTLQIALCCLLVTSSFVALRGLSRSVRIPYGFTPEGVTLATLDVHTAGYPEDQYTAIQTRLMERIGHIPGVSSAAYSNTTPLSVSQSRTAVYAPGTTAFDSAHERAVAQYYYVSPTYFATAETKLLAGRSFTADDSAKAPSVAMVNQTLARKLFGTEDVIGKRYPTEPGKDREVVGLVEDGKYETLTEDPDPVLFRPILQAPASDTTLLVRSNRPPAEMTIALRQAIAEVDSGIPIFTVASWPDALGTVLFPARAATISLGILGVLAMMLAVTGIFGLASYTVSLRMRELGIRVALGAQGRQVLRAALGPTMAVLAAGSLVGLLLGVAASRLLAGIVYTASASDPIVILGVVGTMALVGLCSAALPARRALGVDPAVLLRDR